MPCPPGLSFCLNPTNWRDVYLEDAYMAQELYLGLVAFSSWASSLFIVSKIRGYLQPALISWWMVDVVITLFYYGSS